MKKYMVADLVKGIREDLIQIAMEEYNLNESEATRFVDDFPNQSTWADVEEVAESLGVDVTDVEDAEMDAEDISGYGISGTLSIMGTQKYKDESTGEYKEREAEIASVDYQWDSTNKNYVVDMYFDGSDKAYELILSQDELSDLESKGLKYFNENLRSKEYPTRYWPFGSLDHLHWPNQSGK